MRQGRQQCGLQCSMLCAPYWRREHKALAGDLHSVQQAQLVLQKAHESPRGPPTSDGLHTAQALDLSRSEDLLCRNLVCERVGEPCICRLAVALERHAATLAWLSLAGNGLTQLPAALTALPALRHLDLSANGLSALPAGFADLRSLQVATRLGGSCCFCGCAASNSCHALWTSRWLQRAAR